HINIARVRRHGGASVEAAFDEKMRVVPHDLAVLAGAGLRLVGVDDEIVRPVTDLLGHERPLEASGEARAAAPALTRGLHFIDQPVAPFLDEALGPVPGATLARALEAPVLLAVEVPEDAILVVEHHSALCFERCRPADRRRELAVDLRAGLGRPAGG